MPKPADMSAEASAEMVGLLRKCGAALNELAIKYRILGWDVTADDVEGEARNHLQRAADFEREGAPQPAETPSRVWWVQACAAQRSRVGPFSNVFAAARFIEDHRREVDGWKQVGMTSRKVRKK